MYRHTILFTLMPSHRADDPLLWDSVLDVTQSSAGMNGIVYVKVPLAET